MASDSLSSPSGPTPRDGVASDSLSSPPNPGGQQILTNVDTNAGGSQVGVVHPEFANTVSVATPTASPESTWFSGVGPPRRESTSSGVGASREGTPSGVDASRESTPVGVDASRESSSPGVGASREGTSSGVGASRVRVSADTVSSAAEAVSETKLLTSSSSSIVGIDGSGAIRPAAPGLHKGYNDPRILVKIR